MSSITSHSYCIKVENIDYWVTKLNIYSWNTRTLQYDKMI